MTSDTRRPEPATDIDPRVSAAYRDLGTPATPAELDQRILERAAAAARHRQPGLLQRWTRPLAWAATITICAAIVLEAGRTPDPDGIMPPTPAPGLERATPPRDTGFAAPVENLADKAASDPGGPVAVPPPAEKARQRAAGSAKTAAPAAMSELPEERGSSLESAREPQADTDAAHALAMPAAAGLGNAVSLPACDAEQRADPDRWLACINDLEQRGDDEAASRERDLLAEAFPEFPRR